MSFRASRMTDSRPGLPDGPEPYELDSRYEPIPSLLAAGTQRDLDLEARRLSLLVRAEQNRRTIAARRAEGWRTIDDMFCADEIHQVNGSRAPYKDYEAGAGKFRAEAEAYKDELSKNRADRADQSKHAVPPRV